jgi:DNA-binding NarL/FixJ family response regulator
VSGGDGLPLAALLSPAQSRSELGTRAQLDLAAATAQSGCRHEAARLAGAAQAVAQVPGAVTLVRAAAQAAGRLDQDGPKDPWHPLTAREFEVAVFVAEGLTNPQIAERLTLARKRSRRTSRTSWPS